LLPHFLSLLGLGFLYRFRVFGELMILQLLLHETSLVEHFLFGFFLYFLKQF
jgi:hypothetical protein